MWNTPRYIRYKLIPRLLVGLIILVGFSMMMPRAHAIMMPMPDDVAQLPAEEQGQWLEGQTRHDRDKQIEVGKERYQRRMAVKEDIAKSVTHFAEERLRYINDQQQDAPALDKVMQGRNTQTSIIGFLILLLIIFGGYKFCLKHTQRLSDKAVKME